MAPVDYDTDNDNLIEINTRQQLNAIRWDLSGSGVADNVVSAEDRGRYAAAFAHAAADKGCSGSAAGGRSRIPIAMEDGTRRPRASSSPWMLLVGIPAPYEREAPRYAGGAIPMWSFAGSIPVPLDD